MEQPQVTPEERDRPAAPTAAGCLPLALVAPFAVLVTLWVVLGATLVGNSPDCAGGESVGFAVLLSAVAVGAGWVLAAAPSLRRRIHPTMTASSALLAMVVAVVVLTFIGAGGAETPPPSCV